MLTAHPVKTILSLLLIFSLSLVASGCGSANEEKVIGESVPQAAVSAEETANHADSEIPDKFVMLKEVYDILSSSLGEPYRTPEYWGGEEIDMMKAGDNYLIGLRNVQNQMHYLLYERKTDSIIEIDTQGKHIPWDRIYGSPYYQEIEFSYFVPDIQTYTVRRGSLTYSLTDHSFQDTGLEKPSLPRPEEQLEFPNSVLDKTNKIYNFDFLFDIIEKLPEIYFSDQQGWGDFGASNICILNQDNYVLICLEGQSKHYYLYQKSISAMIPLNVPDTFWDLLRFQPDKEYLVFPSPTGQEIPNAYFSYADFPYITLLPLNSPNCSRKQRQPLWNKEHDHHLWVGARHCVAEWEVYHTWQTSNSFSVYWDRCEPNICQGDDCCPEIRVKISPERSVIVWVKNGILSDKATQQLLNLQVTGLKDVQLSFASLKEIEPMLEEKTVEKKEERGICISFILEEGYQIYGEFFCTDDFEHPEAFLSFYTTSKK